TEQALEACGSKIEPAEQPDGEKGGEAEEGKAIARIQAAEKAPGSAGILQVAEAPKALHDGDRRAPPGLQMPHHPVGAEFLQPRGSLLHLEGPGEAFHCLRSEERRVWKE